MSHKYSHFPYTDFPYIDDFCDDEVFVFSTLGQGPAGEVGNPGPQGEKGDPGKDGILSFDTVADMQASTDLEVGMTVHTNGFHEIGDGGASWYKIEDSGTEDGISVISCDMLYAHRIEQPYISPDMFSGNDTEKLQSCFDALVGTGGNIVLNRNYNIDDIVINNDSNNNIRINVLGAGKYNKVIMTGSFIGKSGYNNNGNVTFHNLAFVTSDSTLNAFDCDRLIRLYFDHCVFVGFNDVFHNDSHLMQTMYITNCMFRGINGTVFNAITEAYDIKFSECLVEASANFMYIHYGMQINVIDNCIEGLSGYVFKCDHRLRSCNICFNYFELNATYIDCGYTDARLFGLNIYGNLFAETTSDKVIVVLPNLIYKSSGHFVTIEQNVIPDNTARIYWVDFIATPTNAYDLSGLSFKNNTKTAVNNFKTCAGYIPLKEFDIPIGTSYDCVVVFGSDGTESSCVNIPLIAGGVYKIEVVSVVVGNTRDASLYSGQRLRNIGFNFACNNATERAHVAGKHATITFRVMPA